MIEQNSTAGHYRIGAPTSPVGRHGDRRLSAQGLPANSSHSAERALVNKRRNTLADRRFEPIVDDMNGAAGGRCRGRYLLRIL
jgi:hypothetical protein